MFEYFEVPNIKILFRRKVSDFNILLLYRLIYKILIAEMQKCI